MVRYLVDTNVVSEMGKGVRCDLNVAAWYASVEQSELRLSALVIGEIRTGVETLRPRAPRRAHDLERWLSLVVDLFADRIIAIDRRIAEQWGRLNAAAKRPAVDGLMAATALVHGAYRRDAQRARLRPDGGTMPQSVRSDPVSAGKERP